MPAQSVQSAPILARDSKHIQKPRRFQSHTLPRLIEAFGPYKWLWGLMILTIVMTTLLGLVSPFMIRLIFDDALPHRSTTLLLLYAFLMFITPVASGLTGVAQNYLNTLIGQSVMRDLRNRLFERLQNLSLRFFTATQTGEIQSRVFNDVSGAQAAMTDTMGAFLTNIATALGALIAMLIISPLLTAISIALLPIFLWITYKVGNTRRKVSRQMQQGVASINALTQEFLSVNGILLIKTFGRQQFAKKRFRDLSQQLTDLGMTQQLVGRWFFMLVNIFFSLTTPIVYLVAGLEIIHSSSPGVSLGGIVAFVALQTRFFGPITQLFTLQVSLQGALGLFDRVFEYIDLPIDIQDKPDALRPEPANIRGEVTFDHVSFTYQRVAENILTRAIPEKRPFPEFDKKKIVDEKPESLNGRDTLEPPQVTLNDISFHIEPGQLVALVGPSGAGKTTITYLLSRLYDVSSGAVSIDNCDVRDLAQETLGELIGVVTQETFLFHTTIRENFLFACPDASDEQIVAACKAAAIHDRIVEFENGYETVVGERGFRLSGGEKQRIAIARVLLKNPRILILDEATSSLDTHSERLIQAALDLLMKDRTTIAIAHRLSTILAADLILVVDRGQIVERGTHQELLQKQGLYAKLYHEQFSQQLQEDMVTQAPL